MEKKLKAVHSELEQIPYFVENPSLHGVHKNEKKENVDIVWGLYLKNPEKTMVLFSRQSSEGHISSRAEKGIQEMVDIPMNLLRFQAANASSDVSLLYVCVPYDAKSLPIMAEFSSLLKQLKKAHGLSYTLILNTESDFAKDHVEITVQSGMVGQMVPFVFVKGANMDTLNPFSGIGSVGILNEVIKAIDQNTEMSDRMYGQMTPPPVFLGIKDLRTLYNTQSPDSVVGYFNWPFFKDNIGQKFAQLKELCVWSAEDAINQYNYSYNEYLRKQRKPSYINCQDIHIDVMLYEELLDRYEGVFPVNNIDEVNGSIDAVKHMVDSMNFENPLMVIGLLPHFLPTVENDEFFIATLTHLTEALSVEKQVVVRHEHFFGKPSPLNLLNTASRGIDEARVKMPIEPESETWQVLKKQLPMIPVINVGLPLSVDSGNCEKSYPHNKQNFEAFLIDFINKF